METKNATTRIAEESMRWNHIVSHLRHWINVKARQFFIWEISNVLTENFLGRRLGRCQSTIIL